MLGAVKTVKKARPRYQVVLGTQPPPAYLRPLKQPLYDTSQYPVDGAGVNSLSFFQVPQGQVLAGAVNKTAIHTNMTQAGQLGTPNQFDVFGFQIKFPVNIVQADYDGLVNNGVFSFYFGQNRPWLIVPLIYVPSGVGKDGIVSTTVGATTLSTYRNGVAHVSNYLNFTVGKNPIRIHSNESFSVRLDFPTTVPVLTAATNLAVYMLGIYYSSL